MENFDLEKDFIEYWDHVIRLWLDQNADVTLFKDDEDAKEQLQVINAINENCKDKKGEYDANYILNTMHMPEPYWGNPTDCSIVLLDYNPAGGPRVNRHTTINCKDCKSFCGESNMTVIKYVNQKDKEKEYKYSDLALRCPVIKEYDDLKWFSDKDNGYEGFNWWQEKRKWLDHLVVATCGKKDDKLPFGMELCGWHSKKWSSNMSWIDGCRKAINERAIQPLFAAMKNSMGDSPIKIAVCIGAEFKSELLEQFFGSFADITNRIKIKISKEELSRKEDPSYEKYKDLSYSVEDDQDERNIHVIATWKEIKKNGKIDNKKMNRNYRVYKITEGTDNYYILNTHYSGSNSHPGEYFWPFEKVLIDKIKEG